MSLVTHHLEIERQPAAPRWRGGGRAAGWYLQCGLQMPEPSSGRKKMVGWPFDRRPGGHHLASPVWPAVTRVQACHLPGDVCTLAGSPGDPDGVRAVAPVTVGTRAANRTFGAAVCTAPAPSASK